MKILTDKEWKDYRAGLAKIAALVAENSEIRKANTILATQVRKNSVTHPAIDVRMADPSPVDREQRALYVAKVAGLHTDILKPKLHQMISSLHSMLEEASNDREYDQSIKGAIYFAWEMLRWGDLMVSEQISIQQNERPENAEEPITPNE